MNESGSPVFDLQTMTEADFIALTNEEKENFLNFALATFNSVFLAFDPFTVEPDDELAKRLGVEPNPDKLSASQFEALDYLDKWRYLQPFVQRFLKMKDEAKRQARLQWNKISREDFMALSDEEKWKLVQRAREEHRFLEKDFIFGH